MLTACIILSLAIAILVSVIVVIGNKTRDARRDELVQEIEPEIAHALEEVSAYYNYSHYITESERTALSNKYEVLGKNLKKVCGTRQLRRSPEWEAADRLCKALSNTEEFKRRIIVSSSVENWSATRSSLIRCSSILWMRSSVNRLSRWRIMYSSSAALEAERP